VLTANAGGVETIASCCGHKRAPGIISLADGRVLGIFESQRDCEEHSAAIMGEEGK